MSYVLVITAPDGTETRHRPVMYGPQLVAAVSAVLHTAAPWLTRRERDSAGMQVARGRRGMPLVHTATGYIFRVEEADTAGLTLLSAVPAQAGS